MFDKIIKIIIKSALFSLFLLIMPTFCVPLPHKRITTLELNS